MTRRRETKLSKTVLEDSTFPAGSYWVKTSGITEKYQYRKNKAFSRGALTPELRVWEYDGLNTENMAKSRRGL